MVYKTNIEPNAAQEDTRKPQLAAEKRRTTSNLTKASIKQTQAPKKQIPLVREDATSQASSRTYTGLGFGLFNEISCKSKGSRSKRKRTVDTIAINRYPGILRHRLTEMTTEPRAAIMIAPKQNKTITAMMPIENAI